MLTTMVDWTDLITAGSEGLPQYVAGPMAKTQKRKCTTRR